MGWTKCLGIISQLTAKASEHVSDLLINTMTLCCLLLDRKCGTCFKVVSAQPHHEPFVHGVQFVYLNRGWQTRLPDYLQKYKGILISLGFEYTMLQCGVRWLHTRGKVNSCSSPSVTSIQTIHDHTARITQLGSKLGLYSMGNTFPKQRTHFHRVYQEHNVLKLEDMSFRKCG